MKNLVILAGGKSIRMGKDKVFLHISDETFIERLFSAGQKYFDRVLISTDTKEHANLISDVLKASGKKAEILTDKYPEQGPLGALVTIFEETDLDRFAVIPVDVPNAQMEFLLDLYEMEDAPIMIAGSEGKYEPLIGVYSRGIYDVLKDALLKNDNKVIRVIENHFKAVPFTDRQKKDFTNINTKADYKELEK